MKPRTNPKAKRLKLPKYVYIAVHNKKKFLAMPYHSGRSHYAGIHDTPVSAVKAARRKLKQLQAA